MHMHIYMYMYTHMSNIRVYKYLHRQEVLLKMSLLYIGFMRVGYLDGKIKELFIKHPTLSYF